MAQYSLFTHGTTLEIETPRTLAGSIKVGWGTQIVFKEPAPENVPGFGTVYPEVGPGSWFHISLPSTLNTFGRRNPYLKSITLLFDASHCRILHVHVYDGADLIQEFNDFKLPNKLSGQFLHARNSDDINPGTTSSNPQTFRNTLVLNKPHKVFSAIGISFYACAFQEDFNVGGFAHNPQFDGAFPAAILTVSAVGGQFIVEDRFPFFTSIVSVVKQIIGTKREP